MYYRAEDNVVADAHGSGVQVVANQVHPAVNTFQLALEHLSNSDARIRALIQAHPQLPVFDGHGMTTFQKLIRALIEAGGSRSTRPTRFRELGNLCQNNVNPQSVAGLGVEQLVAIGVQGQKKATAIISFASAFLDNTDEEIDQVAADLTSPLLYRRFLNVEQIGPFCTIYANFWNWAT